MKCRRSRRLNEPQSKLGDDPKSLLHHTERSYETEPLHPWWPRCCGGRGPRTRWFRTPFQTCWLRLFDVLKLPRVECQRDWSLRRGRSFRRTIASGTSMSVTYLVCEADVHHSAKPPICSDPLRYLAVFSNVRMDRPLIFSGL